MITFILFGVCFFASLIGSICGVGGGIIIKPILDSLNIYDVITVSFLSSCTVLSMSFYSVTKNKFTKKTPLEKKLAFPLAIGAGFGGLIGKVIFSYIKTKSGDQDKVGLIQMICLFFVISLIIIFTLNKNKIKPINLSKTMWHGLFIGLTLGIMSSFLGIGGGPINMVFLYYFFSLDMKKGTIYSLYIIFYSQLIGIATAFFTNNIPIIGVNIIILMIVGGIVGGDIGLRVSYKMKEKSINKMFLIVIVCVFIINLYNIYLFL